MRVWAIAVLSTLALLLGCSWEAQSPNLLNVVDVSPRQLDVGDRIEVLGTGFPEGKPATVTFTGDLHRPGQEPERDVEIVARAISSSQRLISVVLDEALQEQFCGSDEEAVHTTFRGEVVLAFAPRRAGSPPVLGRLPDVVLDVHPPPASDRMLAARLEEAQRSLAFLGIEVEQAGADALALSAVLPKGRADRAGLVEGDVIVELDGMRVRSPFDVIPSGKHRHATIMVERGRLADPLIRTLDVQGFRATPPTELGKAAVLIGIVMVLLLLVSPVGRLLTWAERRVVTRLDARRNQAPASRARHAKSAEHDGALSRLFPYLVFLFASALFTAMAFGEQLIVADLDLGIVVLVSFTALVSGGMVLGGWKADGRWSIVAGLRSAFEIASLQVPALAAMASVVVMAGSPSAHDIVLAQGGMPWKWFVFRTPALFVGCAMALLAALPAASHANVELPEADALDTGGAPSHVWTRRALHLAEWAHVFVLSGTIAVMFFGGWQLPGTSPAMQALDGTLTILGAAWLMAKAWLVGGLVAGLRWILPQLRANQTLGLCWRWLIPGSAVVVGLSVAWSQGVTNPLLGSLEVVVSYVLFGTSVLMCLEFSRRVVAGIRRGAPEMHLNPWL